MSLSNEMKIVYSVTILIFFFIITPTNANADDNITSLKTEIENLKENNILLDNKIIQQKETVHNTDKKFDNLKDNLRELKNNNDDTWESISDIIDAKEEIIHIKKELDNNKSNLQSLLTEKSTNTKSIQILYKDLKILEVKLRSTVSESQLIKNDKKDIKNFNFTGYVKNIGIKLSNSCIVMIQNNITTTCPTYEELYQLDSSNQIISGTFGYEDNFFHRLEPTSQNNWRWYTFDNTLRLFVDPSSQMQSRMKIIEIIPNFDVYIDTNKTKITKNQTQERIIYHDRYIDDYCKTSTINSDKWKIILPDTINHMRQNCTPGTTFFNGTEFIPIIQSEYNRLESPNWQALQWFEESKVKCKELC